MKSKNLFCLSTTCVVVTKAIVAVWSSPTHTWKNDMTNRMMKLAASASFLLLLITTSNAAHAEEIVLPTPPLCEGATIELHHKSRDFVCLTPANTWVGRLDLKIQADPDSCELVVSVEDSDGRFFYASQVSASTKARKKRIALPEPLKAKRIMLQAEQCDSSASALLLSDLSFAPPTRKQLDELQKSRPVVNSRDARIALEAASEALHRLKWERRKLHHIEGTSMIVAAITSLLDMNNPANYPSYAKVIEFAEKFAKGTTRNTLKYFVEKISTAASNAATGDVAGAVKSGLDGLILVTSTVLENNTKIFRQRKRERQDFEDFLALSKGLSSNIDGVRSQLAAFSELTRRSERLQTLIDQKMNSICSSVFPGDPSRRDQFCSICTDTQVEGGCNLSLDDVREAQGFEDKFLSSAVISESKTTQLASSSYAIFSDYAGSIRDLRSWTNPSKLPPGLSDGDSALWIAKAQTARQAMTSALCFEEEQLLQRHDRSDYCVE